MSLTLPSCAAYNHILKNVAPTIEGVVTLLVTHFI